MNCQDLYRFLVDFHKKENRMPEKKEVIQETGLSEIEYTRLMKELEETGKIYRNHSVRKIIPYQTEKKNIDEKKIKTERKSDIKLIILKISIGIIGILSVFTAIWYSFIWYNSFLEPVKSLVISFCFIGFSIICFESGIMYFSKNKAVSIGFFAVFIIIISINILNTIAGQFNLYEKKQAELERSNSGFQEMKSIDEMISRLENQLEIIENQLQTKKSESWQFWKLKKDYEIIVNKLSITNERKIELLKTEKTYQTKDFFTEFSRFLKISPDAIKFIMSTLPAVFLDLISSVSFALLLFLKGGDEV